MLISTRILAIVVASLALAGVAAALASTSGEDESASANGSVKRAIELLEGN